MNANPDSKVPYYVNIYKSCNTNSVSAKTRKPLILIIILTFYKSHEQYDKIRGKVDKMAKA